MDNLPEDSIKEILGYLDYPIVLKLINKYFSYEKLADKHILKEISKKHTAEECVATMNFIEANYRHKKFLSILDK